MKPITIGIIGLVILIGTIKMMNYEGKKIRIENE